MTHSEKNNFIKRTTQVTSAIIGVIVLGGLLISILGGQYFTPKKEFKSFTTKVEREYVHNKVFQAEMAPVKEQVQKIYDHLLGSP
jgi:hypothetical protein